MTRVTRQCPAPSLGSLAPCEAGEKSPRSRSCIAQLAGLQAWEMPPCCANEGPLGGWSWQYLPGVPSSRGGTQSQGVPKPCRNQPAVYWAAVSLDAFPPVITGDASLTAFRTERVRRQYRAVGVGARFVPHLSPELNISGKEGEMGQLGWDGRTLATQPFSSATSSNSHLLPRQRAAP